MLTVRLAFCNLIKNEMFGARWILSGQNTAWLFRSESVFSGLFAVKYFLIEKQIGFSRPKIGPTNATYYSAKTTVKDVRLCKIRFAGGAF